MLEWWHVTRRLGLINFERRCITYVADRFEQLQCDPRLLQMPPQALLQLLAEVHGALKHRHVQFSFKITGGMGAADLIPSKEYSGCFCSAVRCPGHHSTSGTCKASCSPDYSTPSRKVVLGSVGSPDVERARWTECGYDSLPRLPHLLR